MLCTVSDEGVYTVNCELYILEKRNAELYYFHLRDTKELYITDDIVDLKQYMNRV